MNFQTPSEDGYGSTQSRRDLAGYLNEHAVGQLRPLTTGMFGYSVSRPLMSKGYFHGIFDQCSEMGCPLEGWHTESGPGVYEAVSFHYQITTINLLTSPGIGSLPGLKNG